MDASGAAAFALPTEKAHAGARQLVADLAAQNARLIAPPLFESEADSIIRRMVYMSTLTPQAGQAVQKVMDALRVEIIHDPATRGRARIIAEQLNQVRVYDSTYAALADLRGCTLWTADERFYNAARSTLSFVQFIGNYSRGDANDQA
jgi:predicted nucleic acid-binding protein